jgi:peptidoglycan/LPS O-acetylase OafA/YrhL
MARDESGDHQRVAVEVHPRTHVGSNTGIEMTAPGEEGAHLPSLDGLRAVAIILVVLRHVADTGPGWVGVDLFFVLSGFLITGICLDHRGPGFFKAFYARRALRILPPYFAVLAGVSVLSLATRGRWPIGIGWLLAFATNVGVALGNWQTVAGGTQHFWSLAVEEQFYLAWPLVVVLGSAAGSRKRSLFVAGAAVLVAPLCRWWMLTHGGEIGAYVFTVARCDTLALGALLALAYRSAAWATVAPIARRWGSAPLTRWLGVLVALLALVGVSAPDGGPYGMGLQTAGYSLIALTSLVLITCAIAAPASAPLSRALRRPWLIAVGRRSYAIYLFQGPIVEAMKRLDPRTVLGWCAYAIATAAVTYGLAALSWRYLERPILAYKRAFPYGSLSARRHDEAMTIVG